MGDPRRLDATVKAAVKGDEDAFATLWQELNPVLTRYLRVLVGPGAEDMAAEAWLAIVPRVRRFVGGEPEFRAWLFTVARSKVVDSARWHARRPTRLVDDWTGLEPADPMDVAAVAVANRRADDIVELLAQLPQDQADVVSLRVLADLDTAVVAEMLGKTVGHVRVLQHRALKKLAGLVDPVAREV